MSNHQILKAKIIETFGTQADFGQALGVDDSVISRVLRGRKKLTKICAATWLKKLKCDPSLVDAVTKD